MTRAEIVDAVSGACGGEGVQGPGMRYFDAAIRWPAGAALLLADCPETQARQQGTCCLILDGVFFDGLSYHCLRALLATLDGLEASATRLDVYQDHEREKRGVKRPEAIWRAWRRGEVCRFQNAGLALKEKQRAGVISAKGATVYLGERGDGGSGKMLRVYDKMLCDGPDWPFIRWELEATGDRAKTAWREVLGAIRDGDETGLAWTCAALVLGSVDFREANGQRLSRRPRCKWWAAMLDGFGEGVRLRLPVRRTSIEQTQEWAARQWPRAIARLARYAEGQGGSLGLFLQRLRATGDAKWSARDQADLDAALAALDALSGEDSEPLAI